MSQTIHLTVNGEPYDVEVAAGEKLVDLLRKGLHLTGTKVGCGEGRCGTCTVLLDGKPIKSCLFPAEKADGKSVLTIEGLAKVVEEGLQLHPLQTAFVEYGAIQCGFCTPGMIMTAYALLEKHPEPTKQQIQQALTRNLCRCGGYPSIENAILAAASALKSGQPVVGPEPIPTAGDYKVIGKTLVRPDAVDKATGRAEFTDDLYREGMLFVRVKRAGVPHAILRKVDVSRAKALPGVVVVLTAEDLPGAKTHGLVVRDWPVLVGVGERVRYEGDAIVILAAETQAIADEAIERIELEFDRLPVVTGPVMAKSPDAPKVHAQGNQMQHIKVRKGDVAAGFAESDLEIEEVFHTPTMDHAFMEPECSLAEPLPDGRMAVYVGSQIPYDDRSQVAAALGVPEEQVRIVGQTMGGGFGGKEDISGQIHSALLAQATGKPVKLLFDRKESMLVHPKRHATQIRVKLGADADGRLVAAQTELYGDTGAYASLGDKVMTRATTHSAGPYVIPHTRADCYAMYTNNPPAGAFRGFGALQAMFAIESMMDILAHRLQMDPFTLRRMNALRIGTRTNTNQLLVDSVGLVACLDRVKEKLKEIAGDDPFTPVTFEDENQHFVSAWGIAAAFKNTGLGSGAEDRSGAEVELLQDGTFEVRTSAAELGQGLVTVLRMIVAEELGADPEQVRVLVMDTDLTPDGGPTTASRQSYVSGNAARLAARKLRKHLANFVTSEVGKVTFNGAGITVNGDFLTYIELAKALDRAGETRKVLTIYDAPQTEPLGSDGAIHFAFGFAVQAVQIAVNPETGEIRVLKVITANDAGKVLNPLGLKGQVEGGIIMGIGHALTEAFEIEEGHILTDGFGRYKIPSVKDVPEIISIFVEDPTQEGPYGAKGVGEIVSIPTPPAIANALNNAMGVRVKSLPITPEKVLEALRKQ
ncbi:MAG: molybdopterin-dependent oxidoreductase [Anaerolineaceae bacterium]|nr:molybdopterin-dependent oxidoreductase [Anaerolineaceae bacterium]